MIRLSSVNLNKAQPNQILNRKLIKKSPLETIINRGDDLKQINVIRSLVCLCKIDSQV